MRFLPAAFPGAYVIEPEPAHDDRGFFARTFCAREFSQLGLEAEFVQCSTSFNARRGTLRGLHYQREPAAEAKLVRCTAGAILDVMVDVRPGSPTFGRHFSVELTAGNRLALYVPPGFAHGFQTLEDATEVLYQISEYHAPEQAAGIRFDDPRLGLRWPLPVTAISERDRRWPGIA